MATALSDSNEHPLTTPAEPRFTFDAFISYSRSDEAVADGLQKGLHRIGRRVGQLHALRVFRDKTDLVASPSLWGKITEALGSSRYFIAVLSPAAAASEWVNKEISYWLEQRGPENLLLVLVAGRLEWEGAQLRFDPDRSDAAPPVLAQARVLEAEPIYVDVSQNAPWHIHNPGFRDKVTDIAAPIHGRPKYELSSDDLREQRRFRWLRRGAIAALALLTVLAVAGALVAVSQRNQAEARFRQATSVRLVSEALAMLDGTRPGGDARAVNHLLAAAALSPATTPDAMYTAAVKTYSTHKLIQTGSRLQTADISPDGRRIAAAGEAGTLGIWDAESGRQIETMNGHAGWVDGVAFSPDGHRIASSGDDRTIRLWDADTGHPIGQPMTGHSDEVMKVTFSPDGHTVASASKDSTVRLWSADTGQPVGQPLTHTAGVMGLAFSPDGGRLATASWDNVLRIWDVSSGRPAGIQFASFPGNAYYSVTFSPDGRQLAAASFDRRLHVWDVATGQLVGDPSKDSGSPLADVRFSPDGRVIASADQLGDVRLWDAATHKSIGPTLTGLGSGWAVRFSPDGNRLISASNDGLRIWDLNIAIPISGNEIEVTSVQFSPDGHRIASAGCDDTVRLFDAQTSHIIGDPLRGHTQCVSSVTFSPDGERLASASLDGTARLWDTGTGTPIEAPLDAHQGPLRSVAISPDGRWLATAGESTVQLWDARTLKPVGEPMRHDYGVLVVAFNPKGNQLASGGHNKSLRLWDTATRRLIAQTPAGEGEIEAVAFSPDGRFIAAADVDDGVIVRDSNTLREVGNPFNEHRDMVFGIAFSPDGRTVASASRDTTVRLWELQSKRQIGESLTGHTSWVEAVAFSPDGKWIVSGSADGTLRRWPAVASPAVLCDKLAANMSHKQWNEWVSPDIDYIKVCENLPIASD